MRSWTCTPRSVAHAAESPSMISLPGRLVLDRIGDRWTPSVSPVARAGGGPPETNRCLGPRQGAQLARRRRGSVASPTRLARRSTTASSGDSAPRRSRRRCPSVDGSGRVCCSAVLALDRNSAPTQCAALVCTPSPVYIVVITPPGSHRRSQLLQSFWHQVPQLRVP